MTSIDSSATPRAFKDMLITSTVVGCLLLGDSFLYVALPLEHEALGLSLLSVGILLSINRFIRFFSNIWAGQSYARYGLRLPLIFASCVGVLTTLSYGFVAGFLSFVVVRAIWGISWSFLRLGGYLRVTELPEKERGKAMGLYQSISRTGSLMGILVGSYLLDLWGFSPAVIFLALLSAMGIPLATVLKDTCRPALEESRRRSAISLRAFMGDAKLGGIGLVTTVTSLVRSLLAATLALHLLELVGADTVELLGITLGIATVGGLLVAMQWIGRLVAGPLFGLASDHFGRPLILGVMFLGATMGMGILGFADSPAVTAGSAIVVFFSSAGLEVVLATSASDMAASRYRDREYVMSSFSNWVDLGSALGPITAYGLRIVSSFQSAYLGSAVILFVVAILHRSISTRASS